jgi:hypothetical protein
VGGRSGLRTGSAGETGDLRRAGHGMAGVMVATVLPAPAACVGAATLPAKGQRRKRNDARGVWGGTLRGSCEGLRALAS